MQVAHLVQDDWVVDDARLVNFIKLLDSVVFLEVEAEYAVHVLALRTDTSNQQDLLGRYFDGLESPERRGNFKFH